MAEGKVYNFYNGSQNVEHVESQVNNYNFYGVERPSAKEQPCESPGVLDTPLAQQLWRCAEDHGWTDDGRRLMISQTKGAIMASVMADILNLSPRWSAFEHLWSIKDMPTKLCQAQECKYYADFMKEVEGAFSVFVE